MTSYIGMGGENKGGRTSLIASRARIFFGWNGGQRGGREARVTALRRALWFVTGHSVTRTHRPVQVLRVKPGLEA